ncbi:M56 family metallopeptidase [Confluentibacter citreus]|uniref:M56 family metallopeptidase n=1 Tax=Confluentibacter citreus TaxID=2007307 RepID=UPI001EFEA398|nr:M56 family metallopeptidase [Confluentibacter citreus]
MIAYFIQVAAFQLVFLMIYDAFLKKETFFNWNRIYLLSTAILSVVIPFIRLEAFKNTIPQQYIVNLPEVIIGNTLTSQNTIQLDTVIIESKPFWTWENVLYLGITLAALLFAFKIAKVILMLIKNPKSKFGNLLIINLLNSNAAFSFFNYIFLGDHLNETDKDAILKHEMVHVKEKHTFDLLFFEVMRILFWFNPLVYMYQNRIMTLHEFIADQQAVKHQDKSQYYQNLLSQVFQTQNISFINPFFKQSLIKKRIVMLQKSKSKQVNLLKYIMLIPLVFGMLIYTSSFAQNDDKVPQQKEQNLEELTPPPPPPPEESEETKKEKEERLLKLKEKYKDELEVPFAVIDNVPVFPGCENLASREEKMDCTSKSITEHIGKNFNTDMAVKLGLKGRQRILVIFKIDVDGNIVGVQSRAPHPSLEAEAIRVINTLPKMVPGEHNGKKVIVPYSLPIMFIVAGTDETSITNNTKIKPSITEGEDILMLSETVIVGYGEIPEVPFAVIEQVPVFPGCEDLVSNDEKRRCMSEKIQEFVGKNFNTNLASQNGLVGRQRITTMFKINTEGNIVDIKSRASHPALEAEIIRVIELLPKIQPGKQRGEAVIVPYSLPIVFVVQDDKPELEKK